MELTYRIIENGKGYVIMNRGVDWIVQLEYFPFPSNSIEESAKLHISELLSDFEQNKQQLSSIDELQKQIELQSQAIAELTMFLVNK